MAASISRIFSTGKVLLGQPYFLSKFCTEQKQDYRNSMVPRREFTSMLEPNKFSTLLERIQSRAEIQVQPCRGKLSFPVPKYMIKHSKETGTMETMTEVPERFFRLNHGLWIRPKMGRDKEVWRKTMKQRYHMREHVFCNSRQCRMLDKMVSKYYKRPHYFIDDIYEPYQKRHGIVVPRRKYCSWNGTVRLHGEEQGGEK